MGEDLAWVVSPIRLTSTRMWCLRLDHVSKSGRQAQLQPIRPRLLESYNHAFGLAFFLFTRLDGHGCNASVVVRGIDLPQ